ncbi:MAG: right-handed parallel beta-helix repeat-containing protein [Actinomycetota bacterium]
MTPPASGAAKAARTAAASGAILSIGAALVGPVSPASADVDNLTVTDFGDSGAGTLRDLIAATNDGDAPGEVDVINVPAGSITLTSGVIEIDEPLTLTGAGASSVTISGDENSRIFYINTSGAVTISGVTLTDGDDSGAGGAIFSRDADLTIQSSVVSSSDARSSGGALAVRGGSLTVADSQLTDNTAYDGGGAIVTYNDVESVSISGSTFSGNEAEDYAGGGAAINVGSSVTVTNSTFTGNTADYHGGGLYVGYAETVTVTGSTFSGNSTAGGGGGLSVHTDAPVDVTVSGSTFTDNTAEYGGGGLHIRHTYEGTISLTGLTITGNVVTSEEGSGDGGGIFFDGVGSDITISDATITGNEAEDDGGGIALQGEGGEGGGAGTLAIVRSTISGNTAGDDGGGVSAEPLAAFTLDRSTVSGNEASEYGGGIHLYDVDSATITSSTISGNSGANLGGGAFINANDDITVAHSTIVGNDASYGGGLAIDYVGDVLIDHVILSGNTVDSPEAGGEEILGRAAEDTVPVTIANSLVEGTTANLTVTNGEGNILGEDAQVLPLADNGGPTQTHALAETSPALDGGDPAIAGAPATDQRGLARVQGEAIDIGAYETQVEDEETPREEPPAAQPVVANPTFTG